MRTQWLPLVKPFGAQPPTLTTARAEGGMDPQHARRRPHSLIGKRGYAAVAGLVGLIGLVVIMVLGTLAQYASAGPGGSAQEENEWVTSSFSGEQGESAGESSDVVFTALVGGAAEEHGHALEEESSFALAFLSDETLALALAEEETPELRAEADRRLARSLPDLSMMENGNLESALLCEIPWESYYTILCVTLPSLERLNEAFTVEFGTNLPIQSGYRTYDEQAMVHADAPYMTTLPGMSYHGWGLAVDFDIDNYRSYDHPQVVWLVENAPSYGWRNPTQESFSTAEPEPCHFEFGTKHTSAQDWGFHGPIPEVRFLFALPEGWHAETLLSIGEEVS